MARLTPRFSTNRTVRQYTDEHYLRVAAAFNQRSENRGSFGADLLTWQTELRKHWPTLRFGSATVKQQDGQNLFQVQVFLGNLDPDAVAVELYAEEQKTSAPMTEPMTRGEHLTGSTNGFTYTALVPATRPVADYTPRLIPHHPGAIVPLEAAFILWHDAPSWR
jgi:glycogen phosphorylase